MSKSSGRITPPIDSPDRTFYPIMNSNLTIRAFQHFLELRYSSGDDLGPLDWAGRCGAGTRVLLKKCREYEVDLHRTLATRVDDVVRMIRVFSDQPTLILKFKSFFRRTIEVSIPAILQRKEPPLPRMISFLEPYGDIQLTFLYEAALQGLFRNRLANLDTSQLLEVTYSWLQKARFGGIGVVMAHKVRVIVLKVTLLDIKLPPPERNEWLASCIWASTTEEMTHLVQRQEKRVREGLCERKDPGELFGLVATLSEQGIDSPDLYKILCGLVREAFSVNFSKAAEALLYVESRPTVPYPDALINALMDVAASFTASATAAELELVLMRWRYRNFALTGICQVMAKGLLERSRAGLLPFGSCARLGSHLSALGVDEEVLASLVTWLLGGDHFDCSEYVALDLLSQLWPAEDDAPPPQLFKAEAILQLVGVPQTPAREADTAADVLGRKLASELPGCSADAEAAIREWREHGSTPLSAAVAPFILQEVRSAAPDAGSGASDLSRSAALVASALRGEPMGLRNAEWALGPFSGAEPAEVDFTVEAVGKVCGEGGFSKVVEEAARMWLADGSPPSKLGFKVIDVGLVHWQRSPRGAGLETLRKVFAWLKANDESTETRSQLKKGFSAAVQHVATLLEAIDGIPSSLADLRRAKEGALAGLGFNGKSVLADAVATAWSTVMPSISIEGTAGHFELWWDGQQSNKELIEGVVLEAIQEMRARSEARVQYTFGSPLPPGMQGPPAWRINAGVDDRVPWFVQEEFVEAANSGNYDSKDMFPMTERNSFAQQPSTVRKASEVSGGRCMYCNSNFDLKAHLIWPLELGGSTQVSNCGAVCSICDGFSRRLGPQKWREALDADPKAAASVWWDAQKKANMQMSKFLAQK